MKLTEEEFAVFDLAFLLHTPLSSVLEMPYDEYLGWHAYFKENPVGWREDRRAYAIMRSMGFKEPPETIFPSLKPANTAPTSMKNIKNSAIFKFMLNASGGDRLGFEGDV